MDFIYKMITNRLVKPFLKYYLKKERPYTYKEFKLTIFSGVFHPGLFFSTKFLAVFVNSLSLENCKFCEPGTGAGLISLTALKKGASVTAFDINKLAVDNCRKNFALNKVLFKDNAVFEVYQSDLFDKVPAQSFDYIVVNPPYFFKNASDDAGKAWYVGEQGEYFEKFFGQLSSYIHPHSKIYMILADNCEIERIEAIAKKYNFTFRLATSKKIWWETNYIFSIIQSKI
jgi:release factor glutamine methyltransferase